MSSSRYSVQVSTSMLSATVSLKTSFPFCEDVFTFVKLISIQLYPSETFDVSIVMSAPIIKLLEDVILPSTLIAFVGIAFWFEDEMLFLIIVIYDAFIGA